MADPSKTEKASPKRRQKAKDQGSLLRLQDLDCTIMLWGNLFMFTILGTATVGLLVQTTAYFLRKTGQVGYISQGNLQSLAMDILSILAKLLLPFLAANWLLALGNQAFQHGFAFNPKRIMPKFSKINPANGFKRLFSARSVIEVFKSLAKFAIIAWMAWVVISPRMPVILSTMYLSMSQALAYMRETLFILYRNIMLLMIVVAGADVLYQRHAFEKGMMMTKQEVKDEARDADGNPEVKGRQKRILMASAMRRILTQVPKASVVITNPTHFAVALKYDPHTLAPVLVAKGVDHLALKIKERARVTGVVVVENPPLARAIYHNVNLDKPIPSELYQAVAQVLAYVYHLKKAA
jgi:flagellar biosynthetic protein FlhB